MEVSCRKLSSTPLMTAIAWRSLYCTIAFSSSVSVQTAISGKARTSWIDVVPGSNTLPSRAIIFSSGSKAVKKPATMSWKPLNTERVHTSASVANATPHTEMPEMILMVLCFFFEKR